MKISLAQIDIVWEDKEKNKEKCIEFIKKAAEEKSDLVLFPEMTLTGFSMNVEKIGEENQETVRWFEQYAKKFNIYICFGSVEKSTSGKGKNNCYIVSPEGKIVSKYTKIHPFSFGTETKYYESGKELNVNLINEFDVSTFICYDLRFPEIFQAASKSAYLIAIIANWPSTRREHWKILLKARAIENQCYVAAVNRVGIGDGLEYSGESMIIDPLGNIIVSEGGNETLLTSNIDLDNVKSIRGNFRLKEDRKEHLYISFYDKCL